MYEISFVGVLALKRRCENYSPLQEKQSILLFLLLVIAFVCLFGQVNNNNTVHKDETTPAHFRANTTTKIFKTWLYTKVYYLISLVTSYWVVHESLLSNQFTVTSYWVVHESLLSNQFTVTSYWVVHESLLSNQFTVTSYWVVHESLLSHQFTVTSYCSHHAKILTPP